MTVPYDIPSREMLLALVNQDNNTSIPMDAVQFGNPALRFGNYNTTVVMSPSTYSNLTGTRPLNYNRLDIEIFLGANPSIFSNDIATSFDLAKAINEEYNLDIREDDIVNEAVIGNIHILRMHENSFAWYGDVLITILSDDVQLSSVIFTSHLSGLSYPS